MDGQKLNSDLVELGVDEYATPEESSEVEEAPKKRKKKTEHEVDE
jgi:hypothetical protein